MIGLIFKLFPADKDFHAACKKKPLCEERFCPKQETQLTLAANSPLA